MIALHLQSTLTLVLLMASIYYIYKPLKNIITNISSGTNHIVKESLTKRVILVIRMVFLQERLLQDKIYGMMHFWFFYGFLVLTIGHIELILYGLTIFIKKYDFIYFSYNHFSFINTKIINIYNISQDVFAFFVVIVSIYALYRRIIVQPKRLMPRSTDAEIILWFISILYISFFLFTSTEICLNEYFLYKKSSYWIWFYPISSLVTPLYTKILSYNALFYLNQFGFYLHYMVFLGFACYVPRSKHMHLIFAAPNIFCSDYELSIKKPTNINFEEAEEFGIDNVKQFSWKDLLNSFACTECGRCNDVCPAHITNKPLKPKKVLNDIKINLLNHSENIIELSNETKSGKINIDEIWACTTCGACVEVCPVLIDSVPNSLIEMRRFLVLTQADNYPKELNSAFRGMENQNNPWGVGNDKRTLWAKNLDISIINDSNYKEKKNDFLLFIGCASSTDEKAIQTLKKFIKILNIANISFSILGNKENCCGDPARRMGNEYLYETLVEKNMEQFNKFEIQNILTTCPHCYNQLKNEYQKFDKLYKIHHHANFILQLIDENKIKVNKHNDKINNQITTFHDPCYIGRYNKDYTSSRNILKHLSVNVIEMSLSKERSFCCGAGGGRMFMDEDPSNRINKERISQAKNINAKNIITACPFCKTMLADGINENDNIQIKDIVDIVFENIK